MYAGKITDVAGILVGNAQDRQAMTGVTAVVAPQRAVAGVDVRGGGPGTRETDALAAGRLVEEVDAVLLCGGSAYGLDAAGGAMRYLEDKGRGYDTGFARVPIVPAAVLYDLGVGRADLRPDAALGTLACLSAGTDFRQGSYGAGCGATVGKLVSGTTPYKSGLGSASMRLPGGAVIGALAAVNAAGDVYDPDTGALLAAGYDGEGRMVEAAGALALQGFPANTTIGVLATDALLTREQVGRLALLAHDGYARAIRPVHLPVDGDTVFSLSTGKVACDFLLLCAMVAEVMARAIANAVLADRG